MLRRGNRPCAHDRKPFPIACGCVLKLGIFTTHPIQYHVPLWRRMAKVPGVKAKVYYFSDHSVRGGVDPGFGVPVAWDIPLLEGYEYEFVSRTSDLSRPRSVKLPDPHGLFRKEKFDWIMIQGYTHGFEWQIRRLVPRVGCKILMRGEFTDLPRRRAWPRAVLRGAFLKWFYRGVDRFCWIGRQARRHLEARGVSAERLFFSPYCVDDELLERSYGALSREQCRRDLGIAPSAYVFLFSGKLIPRKRPLLLAEAVRMLPDRQNVSVIFLGDGPLRGQVRTVLAPCLGSRLIIPGFVNQSKLWPYFRAADAFVLPSEYETWGLVVNEAMQFGLPVIVSDKVGCADDLVLDGQTGLVFPSGDAHSLSRAMSALMADPDRGRRMRRTAREHVRTYCADNAVRGILDAIGIRQTPETGR